MARFDGTGCRRHRRGAGDRLRHRPALRLRGRLGGDRRPQRSRPRSRLPARLGTDIHPHLGISADVGEAESGRGSDRAGRGGTRPHRHPDEQRRDHPGQPVVQDERRGLACRDQRASHRRLPDDPRRAGSLRRAEVRKDPQPLERVGAGQPRPGQLLGRQDGHPGADADARAGTRPVWASTSTRSRPASSPPT